MQVRDLPHLRAVAYARYSTNHQTKLSIERQLELIGAHCEREGIQLVDCYVDEAQTGTNMDREDFQRLLADAERGLFDAVVIYDMQRGSRDVADWFIFRKEMKRLGVKVLSVNNTLGDIDNPNDFLQESITAVLGQHQVLQYRKASIEGKQTRAKKGLFCGGIPPLGYDVADDHYVINEREAAVVRMIFDMYASGRSYREIIECVKKTGVTGKRGQVITPNTLHYILKNPRYTGTFIWFEYEMRHMHKWVGKKNEQPISVENAIPRIVEQHTWELVQQRMQENKKNLTNKGREDRFYLLTGLVRCGDCGGAFAGITVTNKGYSYKSYTCLNKRRLRNCDAKNIKGDLLEQFILNFLRQHVLSADIIEKMADKIIEASKVPEEKVKTIRQEIAVIDTRNSNLYAAIENGLGLADVITRINENNERKLILEQELQQLNRPAAVMDRAALIAILRADADRLYDEPAAQKEIVKRYIQCIMIFETFIRLQVTATFLKYTNKKVATSSAKGVCNHAGSSGKTRTYNPSVNSRIRPQIYQFLHYNRNQYHVRFVQGFVQIHPD